jgi:hypothetical protein
MGLFSRKRKAPPEKAICWVCASLGYDLGCSICGSGSRFFTGLKTEEEISELNKLPVAGDSKQG